MSNFGNEKFGNKNSGSRRYLQDAQCVVKDPIKIGKSRGDNNLTEKNKHSKKKSARHKKDKQKENDAVKKRLFELCNNKMYGNRYYDDGGDGDGDDYDNYTYPYPYAYANNLDENVSKYDG